MVGLANAFVADGFAVDVVAVSAAGPNLKLLDVRVRVVDLQASRTVLAAAALFRYLRASRPAVLLSTQGHTNVLAVVACGLARTGTRLVVREATTLSAMTQFTASRKERWVNRIVPHVYRAADAVIAPSRGVAEDLSATVPTLARSIAVIPNPVDRASLCRLSEQAPDDPWYRGGEPIVSAVGRLSWHKDFETLIRAFAHVSRATRARLLILGEGEERSALTALIDDLGLRERVRLHGFVDNPYPYMRHSALYVLSSCFEGLPNTLLQAAALQVPVVATDCRSGPREILEDGKWGLLVPVGNVSALADAMAEALREPPATMPTSVFDAKYGLRQNVDSYLKVCGISPLHSKRSERSTPILP